MACARDLRWWTIKRVIWCQSRLPAKVASFNSDYINNSTADTSRMGHKAQALGQRSRRRSICLPGEGAISHQRGVRGGDVVHQKRAEEKNDSEAGDEVCLAPSYVMCAHMLYTHHQQNVTYKRGCPKVTSAKAAGMVKKCAMSGASLFARAEESSKTELATRRTVSMAWTDWVVRSYV